MEMKRFNLPLTACVLIVLSVLLVSCVQQAPGTVESAETVELELMLAPEGVFGDITPESYSMQLLADRTGFNFAFRQIPREFLGERIATTLASGDLPDIMQLGLPADSTGTPMAIAHEFGPQGLFVSLSEYIAAGDMPNLVAEMERQPDMEKLMTSPDGNIYAVPQVRRLRQLRPWLQLRADLLEQCGIIEDRWNGNWDAILTLEDLQGAMTCLQEQLGGKPVLSSRSGFTGHAGNWAKWMGTDLTVYYNPYTELYEYGPLMARFRSMVEFMNWMYENGILHPEYATMSDPDWEALARGTCEAGAILENTGWHFYSCVENAGIDQGKFYPVMSLTIDDEKVLWPAPSNVWLGNPLVISASSSPEEIEAAVWLIDYLFSIEGRFLIYQGKEGVDWTYREDGTKCYTDTILRHPSLKEKHYCNGEIPESPPALTNETAFINDIGSLARVWWPEAEPHWGLMADWPAPEFPDGWRWIDDNFINPSGSYGDPLPSILLNEEEAETAASLGTPIDTYLLETIQQMIQGQIDINDDTWGELTSTIESMGAQDIVDAYNAALSRAQ
jgi:putative aldouronate transport system substrate-binding protein